MIPSIPNSDAVAWLIAPATRCVDYVGRQMIVGGLIQRAIGALAGQAPLLLATRQLFLEKGAPVDGVDALLGQQPHLERLAQELISSDFHDVHVSALIAVWSALEVAVEDTLVLLLLREPTTADLLATRGLDVSKHLTGFPTEKTARKASRALERKVRQTEKKAGDALAV